MASVLAGALGAYGWWAVALPPFSGAATAAVVLAGAGAMAWGWTTRPGTGKSADFRRVAPWAVVAVALGAWQLTAYLQHPRDDHPTLSSLTNALLDTRPARAVAFVAWVLAAAALARR